MSYFSDQVLERGRDLRQSTPDRWAVRAAIDDVLFDLATQLYKESAFCAEPTLKNAQRLQAKWNALRRDVRKGDPDHQIANAHLHLVIGLHSIHDLQTYSKVFKTEYAAIHFQFLTDTLLTPRKRLHHLMSLRA